MPILFETLRQPRRPSLTTVVLLSIPCLLVIQAIGLGDAVGPLLPLLTIALVWRLCEHSTPYASTVDTLVESAVIDAVRETGDAADGDAGPDDAGSDGGGSDSD